MDVVGRATQEAKAEDEEMVQPRLALAPARPRGEREKRNVLLSKIFAEAFLRYCCSEAFYLERIDTNEHTVKLARGPFR